MQKIYVLDTNVVLYDPQAILKFDDNEVVIPITVIEEVDAFKKDANEVGRNARQFTRIIDGLRSDQGTLTDGVKLKSGGVLRVNLGAKKQDRLDHMFTRRHADVNILESALDVKDKANGATVIFLSKDTNLRIRADALGIDARDYDPQVVDVDELFTGWRELHWKNKAIDDLIAAREVSFTEKHYPNEMFVIKSNEGNGSVLARSVHEEKKVRVIPEFKKPVWGISPRNLEQTFALDLLLDDSVQLVSLVGKAGTGKTLLALAAGLNKVMEEQAYQRVLVSRPVLPMGRDIGFLPGDMEEKLLPWMQPIFDNIELLVNLSRGRDRVRSRGKDRQHELMDMGCDCD